MSFLLWNDTATELIKGKIGEKVFCSNCEAQNRCNKSYGKIHPLAMYVYQYVMEFDNGIKIYPSGKSWEHEPDWFIRLFTVAKNKLNEIRNDPEWVKRQELKAKRLK